jgi:hypothetical protein
MHYFTVDSFLAPLTRELALSTESGEAEAMSDRPLGLVGKFGFVFKYPSKFTSTHVLTPGMSAIDIALLIAGDCKKQHRIVDGLYFEGFTVYANSRFIEPEITA